jgi:hypothetical protein
MAVAVAVAVAAAAAAAMVPLPLLKWTAELPSKWPGFKPTPYRDVSYCNPDTFEKL